MKTIRVFSKDALKDFLNDECNYEYVLIEIRSHESDILTQASHNIHHSIFYDIDQDMNIYKTISDAQAKDMFEFIINHINDNIFIISCDAGISRSGAVADFLYQFFRYELHEENIYFPEWQLIEPNITVRLKLKKFFNIWYSHKNNLII